MTGFTRRHYLLGLAGLSLAPGGVLAEASPQGRLLQPRPLRFPSDNGSHNHTRTEWWYLTGHALGSQGQTLGFQVTFFRSRIDAAQSLRSRLAARQLLFAHAAITDVQGQRLWHDQRIARWNGEVPAREDHRTGLGTAFADDADTAIRLKDWSMQRLEDGRYRVRVQAAELAIAIDARPEQTHLLQGQQGLSRKGPEPSQSSFYVSHPQLSVSGSLRIQAREIPLQSGRAWLDHEWSEALLHPEAVGWDWIGMNLFDGSSLTAFRLRRADGSAVWAGGSWRTAAQGNDSMSAQIFGARNVEFEPLRWWTSPATQARYPVEWRVKTPAGVFTVKALLDDQELDSRQSTGTVYWEGLSDLLSESGQRMGRGYLEMTGYAQPLVL
ncbi:carotenoid 1,2-hydratase [Hydrogenophaga sp. PAMC20947]|uniref:lipocalin-like domain-containing protein n=1 Tax=Hydrogenophaga sp. PAMC20947 TaxID=2565558 RepID=UPI00109D9591|nr:carotenoid 1,2-hydratase [Hydrogenophaga sp. PAMC20947]QCB46160.1 carotenoid 1,2-hydratase [Hydrogenophaga sp. PAMC20947]